MNKKLFHTVITILFIIFMVVSCPQNNSSDDDEDEEEVTNPLRGEWLSSWGETYKIADDEEPSMFYNYYGDSLSYSGEIVSHADWSGETGYITIKYVTNNNVDGVAGKFYRLHWKDRTDSTCSFSAAYKADGESTMDTKDGAISEFTVENGYFGVYSECEKQ